MSLTFFHIPIWGEVISCYSTTEKTSDRRILFLHGAWKSDKTRLIGISDWLSQNWIESVGFDFSWHGESTHNTHLSIRKRIQEASSIIDKCFSPDSPFIICAFSMSGQVTYELLRNFGNRIEKCFLCAPALYHQDAIDIPFWPDFSNLLRLPKSYLKHNISDTLALYHGEIIIIIWDNDDVIPSDVPDIIQSAHIGWKNKKITIPNAPHMLAGWTMQSTENLNILCQIIRNEIPKL